MFQHVQRPGIKAFGERIIDQPVRHPQHIRPVHLFDSKALQCAEVIDIAQFAPQSFEDVPVPVTSGSSICVRQMLLEIALHQIVVEKSVVDVEQKYDGGRFGHRSLLCSNYALRHATMLQLVALPRSSFATSVTRSGSNRNLRCNSLRGADAPNVFMPMMRPDFLPT